MINVSFFPCRIKIEDQCIITKNGYAEDLVFSEEVEADSTSVAADEMDDDFPENIPF